MAQVDDIFTQWEAICEAATMPPWESAIGDIHLTFDREGAIYPPDTYDALGYQVAGPLAVVAVSEETSGNLDFISAARTGWPAAIRALKVAMDELWVYGGKDEYDRPTSAAKALAEIQAILEGRDG